MALPVNGSPHLIPAYYSFYRPRKDERLSWPSWLTCSGWLSLPTLVVTHQLQVERRTGKVRRPETDVLPLCHATKWFFKKKMITWQLHTYPIVHCIVHSVMPGPRPRGNFGIARSVRQSVCPMAQLYYTIGTPAACSLPTITSLEITECQRDAEYYHIFNDFCGF